MPKVSVIIPNYNHAPYLQRRIDSVLAQTYTDFELILLDDCSTDNSAGLLLSYQHHPKVSHVLINDQNTGSPFEQWNKGFQLAKGDFIWIAESDDWCESTLLETLVEPLIKDDSIVLSFCQSLLITERGEIIYRTERKKYEENVSGKDFVINDLFGDTVLVNAGMVVFRASALKDIDLQYMNMRGAGDWLLWVEIALQGNVFVSAKTLNYCLRHEGTVTSKSVLVGLDIEEGNRIFNYVYNNTNPTASDIKRALKQRLHIYFNQKNGYASSAIRKKSFYSVVFLHPDAKYLYIRILIKRFLNKIKLI